jgi:hypothetical protein
MGLDAQEMEDTRQVRWCLNEEKDTLYRHKFCGDLYHRDELFEEGNIQLDDTIDKFLDNQTVRLDSLLIYNGISYGRQITVKHLLSHTSGIKDYMEDERFIPDVVEHPRMQYSPAKILGKYYEYQTNHKAMLQPGEDFNYSDVNTATTSSHPNVQYFSRTTPDCPIGPLSSATIYYWRVDEVNTVAPHAGLWKGRIWVFRTLGGAGGQGGNVVAAGVQAGGKPPLAQ